MSPKRCRNNQKLDGQRHRKNINVTQTVKDDNILINDVVFSSCVPGIRNRSFVGKIGIMAAILWKNWCEALGEREREREREYFWWLPFRSKCRNRSRKTVKLDCNHAQLRTVRQSFGSLEIVTVSKDLLHITGCRADNSSFEAGQLTAGLSADADLNCVRQVVIVPGTVHFEYSYSI
jgi:hypothetical protein